MIVGIDLGTTNSAAAIWRDGAAVLVPNALGDTLTPSAVAIDEQGRVVVGLAARERQEVDPGSARTLFKRAMGTSVRWKLGRKEFGAEELSALVLRNLKADCEAFSGEAVTGAIVTVPAYFNDKQRKATRRAGELAGLSVERLINEPTAAALAYGIHELEEERPFLVFDLGGGTFDVSIVEIFDGVIEVRSSAGDNRLGGEDFNAVVVEMARGRLGLAVDDPRFEAAMRGAAERCRRALSEGEAAPFRLTWDGEAHEATITGAEFEEKAAGLIARLRDPVIRSLRDGGTKVEGLSEVVLVGGATRMPLVRRAVTRMFGRFPANRVDADHAVALGAAVQAGLMARDAGLKEIRLTDVCPFSLGVDTSERTPGGGMRSGLFMPIIERNTVVPASRVETFATMMDGQRQVEFNVYQGEARAVSENVFLGKVTVPVPAKRAGAVALDCRFSYDASGLLEVDIHVPETDARKTLVIVGDEEEDAAALETRRLALEALKVHPREDARNAAVMARAERCYEAQLGDRRAWVGALISGLSAAYDGQDPREIERVRGEVSAALDGLEGEAFL